MRMEDIIQAAKKEDWGYVDKRIPEVCNNTQVITRAIILLRNDDGNVRDLGASILGKAEIIPTAAKPILFNVMNSDANPYVRYRSAFALAGHKPGKYKNKVIEVLNEASSDNDVGDIAKEYLERLK